MKTLKDAKTLNDVFKWANENYNTDEPLGMFTGSIVKAKIPELIKMLNLKPR
jgi:hypothetical protein